MQEIRWGRLRNGLLFYSHYDRVAHVSGIGVKAGSIHDPPGKNGLAHFTEHAIAERSRSYDSRQIDLLFWKYLGDPDADRNIRIDRTSTFYGHQSVLKHEYMIKCFDVLASLVRDQILDHEILEAEAAAVHQEYLLRGIDDIPELAQDFLHQTMYERNPARNRIDCTPAELRTLAVRDVRHFLKTHYVPNNMFVIMLGPSFEETKGLADKYFGQMEEKHEPTLAYDHSEDFPTLSGVKAVVHHRAGIHQHHAALGFPTETYTTKDAEALDVLARVLEMRLYWALRGANRSFEGGVYRVEARTTRTFLHGLLSIWFATKCPEFALRAREIIHTEINQLRTTRVNSDEIDAAKSYLDYDHRNAFRDSPNMLVEMIIDAVSNGDEDLQGLHTFRSRLRRVTPQKLLKVANKYFTPNYADVSIVPE